MRLDTPPDVAGEIVELAPGAVYRLGGRAARNGRVSWAVADGRWEPISCYLLLEGADALLVDTGVAVHGPLIVDQLAELLPDGARLSLFLTRAELDCMGNVAAISERFPLERIVTGGVVNPFDTFDVAADLVPESVQFTRGADTSSLGVGPGRELDVLRPVLRLLATFWAYDVATRTLFTSDAFGWVAADAAGAPVAADVDVDVRDIRASLDAKFEWLADVPDLSAVIAGVRALFDERPVDAIAPGHGCVLAGRSVVTRHVGALLSALDGYGDA
jgi:flavorubredoxin